ncbi:type II toxin-antitoxin system VapB family antitoxin [Paracoccus benzoatiresistens]|uniref:Type II toxin-antitoxin system VapB family antitoxin n=1 Tax=Paracoccus benzoatiresistens TaxID=2997341 RepID=A0ABT4J7J3_9RHOB|nr:type II toxin-antitoxin system VapB family antitoxin [Paracoccus sp. EF6]MCZ0963096.1 type II toxin-antitoxin system VapB family antitoxin [Paracoccus sp. EF6]
MGELSAHDDSLNDLAEALAEIMGVTKTEAVRQAIQNEIERQRSAPTIDGQIAALQEKVKDYGFKSTRIVPPKGKR